MLIGSLRSRTLLTEVLLKNKFPPVVSPLLSSSRIYREVFTEPKKEELPYQGGKICVRLMVCNYKKNAEAKDFVNLLLSFLSLPLGFVASVVIKTQTK